MSRLNVPATADLAPEASRPLLAAVQRQLGTVPNLFRLVANSPAALEGYLSMSGALAKGALPATTRERIALTTAEFNGCDYCLSAHTYLATHVAKLGDDAIEANRRGTSQDATAAAALVFASEVLRSHGHVSDTSVAAVRKAGYSDAQIVEIVQHVALNVWTNYLNSVAQTEVDFPRVTHRAAA
jgi:uncharacterized peroxidase-related enzyme